MFLGLVGYVAVMFLWATHPWTDTHRLETPAGAPLAFAKYRCPSVFGSGPAVPTPAAGVTSAPVGKPCSQQTNHRVLFFLDLGIAGAGMVLLERSGRRHRLAGERYDAEAGLAAPLADPTGTAAS